MPMKSIFYSDKADDPAETAMVLQAAVDAAMEAGTNFGRYCNVALREKLGLPAIPLVGDAGPTKTNALAALAELQAAKKEAEAGKKKSK